MEIIKGKLQKAQKIVIYGPEGIGKSTFASRFPEPLFIDTEGSTTHLDVARTPTPSSWTMMLEQIEYIKNNRICKTLVIDTADWAERICKEFICSQAQVKSIEDFGYGKGYTKLAESFGFLLNKLSEVIDSGIHVVLTAHAQMRKFEQPEEMGAYDRWELKLEKKTAALTKEWADMILFANYKILVVNVDNQGAVKGKNKASGGQRIMYANHNPSWDAKNRHGLMDEMHFDFKEISHIFKKFEIQPAEQKQSQQERIEHKIELGEELKNDGYKELNQEDMEQIFPSSDIPKSLLDLMNANKVTTEEIQNIVAQRGYFPADTPISNYPPDFINGVLVGAWPQVFEMIKKQRI